MLKLISSVVAATTFITASLNSFITVPKANAVSYRTTYKVYGDLNGDKTIDIYDVISMRKAVLKGDYDKKLDFNCDDVVDSKDLDLLNDYVLGNNTFFDAYLNDDADEDQVCDIYEVVAYNSDPDSKDTDGDTLSDYEEVVYTYTSPTNKYSRGLSVTDADDDPDEDNLTSKEELKAKSEPLIPDTDMDGLSDYDEIKVYFTDPNVDDTDGDGISDGSEVKLKLDPNKTATNGVPDGEYVIQQTIDANSSTLSSVNIGSSPYELSIDIKTNGDAEKALIVGESSYSDAIANDAMLGESIDIDILETSIIEKMVLRFNIDELHTYNTLNKFSSLEEFDGIKRLNVFRYDKESGMLLPLDTEYDIDNNQIYAEVNQTGTYCIMDMEIWLDNFGAEMPVETNVADRKAAPSFNNKRKVPTKNDSVNNIVFLLQNRGNDIVAFNKQKQLILEFGKYIFDKYKGFHIYVVPYDKLPWSSYYLNNTTFDQLKQNLDSIEYYDLDNYYCYFQYATSNLMRLAYEKKDPRIESYSFKGVYTYVYDLRNGNTYNSKSLSEGLSGNSPFEILKDVEYGTVFTYSEIGTPEWKYKVRYFTWDTDVEEVVDPSAPEQLKEQILSNGDLFLDIYETSVSDLIEHFERKKIDFPLYDIKFSATGKQITLDGVLSPYNKIDTDGDGLTDWEEVNSSLLRVDSDGNITYPVFDISDIVLRLKRFKNTGKYDALLNSLKNVIYLPILSDPTNVDSDGDGFTDDVERSRGTDPLNAELIMKKDEYLYLIENSSFEANKYREKYYDKIREEVSVFLGTTCFAGKFEFDLYKSAIVDFLDYAYDNQKTEYSSEQFMEFEKSTIKAFTDQLDLYKTYLDKFGLLDADLKKDYDAYKELTEQLERIDRWIAETDPCLDFQTKAAFYEKIDDYQKMYQKAAAERKGLKSTIDLKKLDLERVDKFLKQAGIVLGAIDVSASFSQTLEGYLAFSDTIERFEMGMEILDILQDPKFTPDDTMRRAAAELKRYASNAENDISFAMNEAIHAGEMELTNFMLDLAAPLSPYTSWYAIVKATGNLVFNYGEISENAEILVAKSFIPDAIATPFHFDVKFDSKNNIAYFPGVLAKKKAGYLINLIMARIDAENQCVNYYEAYPWFSEWVKSDFINNAKSNVSTLDECLKYYYVKCIPLMYC